MLMTL